MANRPVKYIFVTGGVMSGLGKGITAASLAKLFKSRNFKVNLQKCDPYLNVDAGTLNPKEHGECFVTKDGAETDLDLGHYERFIDQELTQSSSVMAGRVILKVIQDERAGKYEGDDVQIIPHLTRAIQKYFLEASRGFEIQIIEIGGTVGDYESLSFLESIREFGFKVGQENCLYVHLVHVPFLNTSQELKTKPAQNSVRELRSIGIFPDILVARSDHQITQPIKDKLALFSGLKLDSILSLPDAKSIYEVPITIEESGIMPVIFKKLQLKNKKSDLNDWKKMLSKVNKKFDQTVEVAIFAKYLDNNDTYISVLEALKAAAWYNQVNLSFEMIDASNYDQDVNFDNLKKVLKNFDGIIVPGGFGVRGLEGKIKAAQYALKNNIPYLGLCLGMQMAVIAAARNAGLNQATSFELDSNSQYQVISTMNDQLDKMMTGGTMRLGDYNCRLLDQTLAKKLYCQSDVVERHRHRGECNQEFVNEYEKWGIKASGFNLDSNLVEVIEGINHPFFLASQFHPELKSRPNRPHPFFVGFVKSLIDDKKQSKVVF